MLNVKIGCVILGAAYFTILIITSVVIKIYSGYNILSIIALPLAVIILGIGIIYRKNAINRFSEKINYLNQSKRYGESITCLEVAIKKQPKLIFLHIYKVMIFAFKGDFDEFYKQYLQMKFDIKMNNNTWYYYLLHQKLLIDFVFDVLDINEVESVKLNSQKYVKFYMDSIYLYITNSLLFYKKNSYEDAFVNAEKFNKLCSLDFYKFVSYYIMALSKAKLGETRVAKDYFEKLQMHVLNEKMREITQRDI